MLRAGQKNQGQTADSARYILTDDRSRGCQRTTAQLQSLGHLWGARFKMSMMDAHHARVLIQEEHATAVLKFVLKTRLGTLRNPYCLMYLTPQNYVFLTAFFTCLFQVACLVGLDAWHLHDTKQPGCGCVSEQTWPTQQILTAVLQVTKWECFPPLDY